MSLKKLDIASKNSVPHLQFEDEAKEMLSGWLSKYSDRLKSEPITIYKILATCGFNNNFLFLLSKLIETDNPENIAFQIANLIKILKIGSDDVKFEIVFSFIDKHNNGIITCDPIISNIVKKISDPTIISNYLKISKNDTESIDNKNYVIINKSTLGALLLKDKKGIQALQHYCNHILAILQKSTLAEVRGKFLNKKNKYRKALMRTSVIYFTILLTIQALIFLSSFFNHHLVNKKSIINSISLAFAMNILVMTALVYASVLRSVVECCYSYIFLQIFMPFNFNLKLHFLCSIFLLINSIGHVTSQIMITMKQSPTSIFSNLHQHSLFRNENNNLSSTSSTLSHGNNNTLSGLILAVILITITITSIIRNLNNTCQFQFMISHSIHFAFLLFLSLHVTSEYFYYIIMIGIIFLLEKIHTFFILTTKGKLLATRPSGNGMTYLTLSKLGVTAPGSFYLIKVPRISNIRWNPIPVSNDISSNRLTFMIPSIDQWTKNLYKLSHSLNRNMYTVLVQGPYRTPISYANPYLSTLLIASGLGIASFLSFLTTYINQQRVNENEDNMFRDMFLEELPFLPDKSTNVTTATQSMISDFQYYVRPKPLSNTTTKRRARLHFIWSIRDVMELIGYIDYIHNLCSYQETLNDYALLVDIYMTGIGDSADPSLMLSYTLLQLLLAKRNNSFVRFNFGRVDLNAKLAPGGYEICYCCAGNSLSFATESVCQKYGIRYQAQILEFTESVKREQKSNKVSQQTGLGSGNNNNNKVGAIDTLTAHTPLSLPNTATTTTAPFTSPQHSGLPPLHPQPVTAWDRNIHRVISSDWVDSLSTGVVGGRVSGLSRQRTNPDPDVEICSRLSSVDQSDLISRRNAKLNHRRLSFNSSSKGANGEGRRMSRQLSQMSVEDLEEYAPSSWRRPADTTTTATSTASIKTKRGDKI